jgi:hypothetical protein
MQELWYSGNLLDWDQGLKDYWNYVKPPLRAIEEEMQHLDRERVRSMDANAWYTFLLERYFRWKYTEDHRYKTTTNSLKMYEHEPFLSILYGIKERIFSADKADIKQCLTIADNISGLGPPGASGLLAVLFPEHFGTVDQFVVKALRQISDLAAIKKPDSLKLAEGVLLIEIMRRKAAELNEIFSTTVWNPRKMDMILWAYGHEF